MDVSVGEIDSRPPEFARALGLGPLGRVANLVDRRHVRDWLTRQRWMPADRSSRPAMHSASRRHRTPANRRCRRPAPPTTARAPESCLREAGYETGHGHWLAGPWRLH